MNRAVHSRERLYQLLKLIFDIIQETKAELGIAKAMKTMIRSMAFFLMSVSLMSGCSSWRHPCDCRVTVAPNLGDSVQIVDLRLQKVHSQHYTMQANVVNNSATLVGLEYKTVWLDAGGEEIPTILSTWSRTSVRPRDIVALQSTAPDESAVDFRLYLKQSR